MNQEPQEETCLWRLFNPHSEIVIAGPKDRIPGIIYWGPPLPDGNNLCQLPTALAYPVAHGGLDVTPAPSLFPELAQEDLGQPALAGFIAEGNSASAWMTRFTPIATQLKDGYFEIIARDETAGLELILNLTLDPETGMLSAQSRLKNIGQAPFCLEWLSCPVLPVDEADRRLLSWHGRWSSEFHRQEEAWPKGSRLWESRAGRTSHEMFPGLISAPSATNEDNGKAMGLHLAHSGNWRIIAEDIAPGMKRILAGALFLPGETILAPGQAVTTPILYATRSQKGLNRLSQSFHDTLRKIAPARKSRRPVHFNSWEALYFDLNQPDLIKLAERAAELGAERFVMDDGWFKGRRHDRAGLGDWQVDREKFPDGLKPLIDKVKELGMSFGIWLEPEMINEDSDLYRAHPDWILQMPSYPLLRGRQQLVLDLSRSEVSEYLWKAIDGLLRENEINYIKWDMNRSLTMPGQNGQPRAQAQIAALYKLLEKINLAYPFVDIESCSSGGGRMDFGIARFCHRFWLSDNNDAHDRWAMAQEASFFFAPEFLGFHIGPSPSHTTGRQLSATYRAYSAAFGGHMGMELDPFELSPGENNEIINAIAFHKKWRELLHTGQHYRLELPSSHLGRMVFARDQRRFLIGVTQRETLAQSAPPLLRLPGLAPDAFYRLQFADGMPIPNPAARRFRTPLQDSYLANGTLLREEGFRLPPGWPDQIWLIEGELHD